jgi:hypothetical protein
VLVFDRTNSVAPTAGFFLVAKFLPALFATGLTARLDQLPLRRALPAIYASEAVVFAALAFLADDGRFVLALVLFLGLIDGTLAITGRGLTRGAVAAILQPRGLIAEGNALMNLGFAASSVFGAALAGGLIAFFGLSVALLVDAATFLIIAVWLVTSPDMPHLEHADYQPWSRRFRAGLSFARSHRLVRTLLIGQSFALICFTIVVPIEVIYAKESLGTTSAGFGVLLSADGIFIIVATVSEQDGSSVVPPEVLARGVPFLEGNSAFIDELREAVEDSLDTAAEQHITETDVLESHLHDDLATFIYERLKRRPMVLPVVVEV